MFAPIKYIPKLIKMQAVFDELKTLDWQQREAPRKEYYVNDYNVPYTYGSGRGVRTYEPQPLHIAISYIRTKIEAYCDCRFEVCFLNYYVDGKDHLGWHADNSPEMDDARPIVSVSLGAEREIWFRPNDNQKEIEKLLLENGSACIMAPGMQDTHQHRIPKAGFVCGERISLTFRGYVK